MHDGAVGAGARDSRERHILEQATLAPEAFERLDRLDLGELASGRFALEPGEEARDRGAVAPVRGTRAFDLDRVLHRLHQRDRIGPARRLAAMAHDHARKRIGRGGLVEPHGFLRFAERSEVGHELGGLAYVGQRFELAAHVVRELAAVDKECGPPFTRNDREGERQRRMRDVAAADVEGPGDVVRIGDD